MTPSRGAARTLLAAWGLALLFLTLRPAPDTLTSSGLCLLCGERGLADAALNVALFLPLGILLSARERGVFAALAVGIALSLGIETIQFFIPGRDASVGDVLFNGTGAVLGRALAPHLGLLTRPDPATARRLATAWAAACVAGLGAVAFLLEPRVPDASLVFEERPPAPEGGRFEGVVVVAMAGGDTLRDGDRAAWPLAARGGSPERLVVRFTAAPPRWAFRPVAGLAEPGGPVRPLLLGPSEDDLVLRLDRPVGHLRLTPADLRWPGALADVAAGDTVTAGIRADGDAACMSVGAREACGFGFGAGSGWALLAPTGWANGSRDRWLDAPWLALCALPLGLWGAGRVGLTALGVVAVAALLAPVLTTLLWTPLPTIGGFAAGWGAGRGLRSALGR